MRFLPTFLLFAAYVLIYSAVAAGGKFATEPWAALFADAYVVPTASEQAVAEIPTVTTQANLGGVAAGVTNAANVISSQLATSP